MRNFLKKHSKCLFFWGVIFIIFALVILIVALENNDKKENNISRHDDTILYENALNNVFNESWYYSSFSFGYWEATSEDIENNVISSTTEIISDDLLNTTSLVDNYTLSLSYVMGIVNTEIASNGVNYVDKLPYFTISFSGGTILYDTLLMYLNNCAYASTVYYDIGFSSDVLMWQQLVNDTTSGKYYISATNGNYTNMEVSWIRFRNGSPLDFTNSNEFEPFQAYFGNSFTYIDNYNIIASAEYADLQNRYSTLYNNYNDLLAKYNTLVTNYDTLNTTYDDLLSQYDTMSTTLDDLTTQYNTLNTNYNTLLEQYNTLLNQSEYSFSELFWSISSVPFGVLTSAFNVDVLGVNLRGIITGLFTALLLIWLIKKFL